MYHRFFLPLLYLMTVGALPAQELTVVSAAAGAHQSGAVEVAWTLGELTVYPQEASPLLVTEGFHQGELPVIPPEQDPKGVSVILTLGNTEGKNDVLKFPEVDEAPENNIVIVNRWGQTVYALRPYDNMWNGVDQSGRPLPEGTYYFVLFLRDGKKEVIHGNVLLLR